MNTTTATALRIKMAKLDMGTAREHGEVRIGETRRGTVELRYSEKRRTYSLHIAGEKPVLLAAGTTKDVAPVLQDVYEVTTDAQGYVTSLPSHPELLTWR